ncbi:MAG: hypothetical protein ACTHKF_07420 [Candidatus Nitrosocosmicus sp.]
MTIGLYSKALQYYNKALELDTELNNKVGRAADYKNIRPCVYKHGQL